MLVEASFRLVEAEANDVSASSPETDRSLTLVSEVLMVDNSPVVDLDNSLKLAIDSDNCDNDWSLMLVAFSELMADALATWDATSLRLSCVLVMFLSLDESSSRLRLRLVDAICEASLATLAEVDALLVWALVIKDVNCESEAEAVL